MLLTTDSVSPTQGDDTFMLQTSKSPSSNSHGIEESLSSQNNLEKEEKKLGESYILNLELTAKQPYLSQCGTGGRTDRSMNGQHVVYTHNGTFVSQNKKQTMFSYMP